MPELPELEAIRAFLGQRIVGVSITSALIRRPIVVRNLLGGDAAAHLLGRHFTGIDRRGKFLLLPLDSGAILVIHPMLAGRIRYGEPLARHRTRDALVLGLADGRELRYHDAKDMGKIYLTDDLAQVPAFDTQGPEATDPDLSLDVFRERLRHRPGEVKQVLTTQTFVAGIGNAYGDEICWRAGLYPFRRCSSLTDQEVTQLYSAMRSVLAEAIQTLGARLDESTGVEVRDFLAVHGKTGQPCPRCGSAISQVKRERQTTNFCRTCQPGLLVGG